MTIKKKQQTEKEKVKTFTKSGDYQNTL